MVLRAGLIISKSSTISTAKNSAAAAGAATSESEDKFQ